MGFTCFLCFPILQIITGVHLRFAMGLTSSGNLMSLFHVASISAASKREVRSSVDLRVPSAGPCFIGFSAFRNRFHRGFHR